MTDIITREFGIHGVRILVRDGDPWFAATDVCRVLEIGNTSQALTRLDDDEKGLIPNETPGGVQQIAMVSESGLYALVLGSRKPDAKVFKRWVTHEVLPSIRKTGSYVAPIVTAAPTFDPSDPRVVVAVIRSLDTKVLALEATVTEQVEVIAELEPKAATYDALMESADTYGFRESVKHLHRTTAVTEREVRTLLIDRGWVQRLGGTLLPASYGEQREYVTTRVTEYTDPKGVRRSSSELRITNKGLARLQKLLTRADAA